MRIEGYTEKGINGIKKNARVPLLVRSIIERKEVSIDPYIIEIRLKPVIFKKVKGGKAEKLIIDNAENLIISINKEMAKFECIPGLDYFLEVLKDE